MWEQGADFIVWTKNLILSWNGRMADFSRTQHTKMFHTSKHELVQL